MGASLVENSVEDPRDFPICRPWVRRSADIVCSRSLGVLLPLSGLPGVSSPRGASVCGACVYRKRLTALVEDVFTGSSTKQTSYRQPQNLKMEIAQIMRITEKIIIKSDGRLLPFLGYIYLLYMKSSV